MFFYCNHLPVLNIVAHIQMWKYTACKTGRVCNIHCECLVAILTASMQCRTSESPSRRFSHARLEAGKECNMPSSYPDCQYAVPNV